MLRLAGRDDIAIADDASLVPGRAGILHVVPDAVEACCPSAVQHTGGTQHPGTVTDGCHDLTALVYLPHEIDHGRCPAHVVWGVTAGNHHGVKIDRPHVRDVGVHFNRVA